jgi:hypothetical protein
LYGVVFLSTQLLLILFIYWSSPLAFNKLFIGALAKLDNVVAPTRIMCPATDCLPGPHVVFSREKQTTSARPALGYWVKEGVGLVVHFSLEDVAKINTP